jgi:serine phosphatase RsbU (regulator of sigma subunit)
VNPTRVDRASRWITLTAFTLALVVFLAAPILALRWSAKPFPGFVVEQTLVVAGYDGDGWSGRRLGLDYPQRVTHLGDRAIITPAELEAAISALSIGQRVQVHTALPDGSTYTYPSVALSAFPVIDLVRLFWLPYGVGLAYLAIGAWVYRVRGRTRPSRAFAHFCVWTSLTCGLLFDLITTHAASAVWAVVIALEGSALVSLALLFPEEWSPIQRRPWLRFLPYGITALLAGWSLSVLYDTSNPWAYVWLWRYSYIYTALGIVIFFGMMLYRQRTSPSAVARQQARIILWGSLFAFTPLGVWLGAPLFGVFSIPFRPVLFLPVLLIFPLSIGVAILRYRLWDIDVIIRRTLVYGVLTVVLASLYFASVVAMQRVFRALTNQESGLAVVVSTLAIAALFNPLRRWIQDFIDRRFYRSKYDAAKTLAVFGATLREEVDLAKLLQRLEGVIGETIQPAYVLTWLRTPSGFCLHLFEIESLAEEWGNIQPVDAEIPLDDPFLAYMRKAGMAMELDRINIKSPALQRLNSARVKMVVPLISQGELIGWLSLGPRLSEQDYSSEDRRLLDNFASQAAPAVRVAQLVRQQHAEARERERIEHEMRVAGLIQQTLLPQELPSLSGWQVAAYWQPARAVGGDFYDFLLLPDGRLFLAVADVADKGVPAALVMATTRSILRGTARRLLSPGEALALANDLLYPELPPHMFVTCLYAILDPVSGRLHFANAGHPLPFWRCDGHVAELWAAGMPLGLMPGMHYEEQEATINPKESLLLYSDGIVEAHNPQGEMFGLARLQSSMGESAEGGTALIDGLTAELARFTGAGWDQEDDVTLVTLQRSEAGG